MQPQMYHNSHEVNNPKIAQMRNNAMHQYQYIPQQGGMMQGGNHSMMMSQQQGGANSNMMMQQRMAQQMMPSVNQQQIPPEQMQRFNQIQNMTQSNYTQHMQRIGHMNDRIMGHHMSNMSSFLPDPNEAQNFSAGHVMANGEQVGNNNVNGDMNHFSFEQDIPPSDMVPTPHQRQNSMISGSVAPPPTPRQYNMRQCECRSPSQAYCGGCQICGMPGHRRPYPGRPNDLGQWCDAHYDRQQSRAMQSNPGAFTGFETFDPEQPTKPPRTVNPVSPSGQYVGPLRNAHKKGGVPTASNKFAVHSQAQAGGGQNIKNEDLIIPPNIKQELQHHYDRQLGVQTSPFTMNESNMGNFKGNNQFQLNRTVVNPNMLKPRENISFAGYNAQGQKVSSNDYYRQTPGRQNEHDFYREYKSNNQKAYYVPSNTSNMNNYKPYQMGAQPRRVKLSQENLNAHTK